MLQSAVSHLSLKRSRPDGPAKARFHQTWISPMRPGNPRRKTLSEPAGFERFAATGFRQCGSHHSRIFAPAGSLGRAPCPVSPGSLQAFSGACALGCRHACQRNLEPSWGWHPCRMATEACPGVEERSWQSQRWRNRVVMRPHIARLLVECPVVIAVNSTGDVIFWTMPTCGGSTRPTRFPTQ